MEKAIKFLLTFAGLMALQSVNIRQSIRRPHGNGRIAASDQDKIHQKARRATIAVVERMYVHQTPMGDECSFRGVRHAMQPSGEVSHQRRKFRRRWEGMAPGIGQHITPLIGIASGNLWIGAQHDQTMQAADIKFGQGFTAPSEFAHITDCVVVVDCFEMIPQRFTGNGDALLDHHRGFRRRQGIPFDRVGCVGEFDIVGLFEVR